MKKRLMTVADLARYVGLSVQTIRNRMSEGTLIYPHLRDNGKPFFDRKEVDRIIDSQPRFGPVDERSRKLHTVHR